MSISVSTWCVMCAVLLAPSLLGRCLVNIWWVKKWVNEQLKVKKKFLQSAEVTQGNARPHSWTSEGPSCMFPCLTSSLELRMVLSWMLQTDKLPDPVTQLACLSWFNAYPCLATATLTVPFSTAVDHRSKPENDPGRSLLKRIKCVG